MRLEPAHLVGVSGLGAQGGVVPRQRLLEVASDQGVVAEALEHVMDRPAGRDHGLVGEGDQLVAPDVIAPLPRLERGDGVDLADAGVDHAVGLGPGGRLLGPAQHLGPHPEEPVVAQRHGEAQPVVVLPVLGEEPLREAEVAQRGVELAEHLDRAGLAQVPVGLLGEAHVVAGVALAQERHGALLLESLGAEPAQALEDAVAVTDAMHQRALDQGAEQVGRLADGAVEQCRGSGGVERRLEQGDHLEHGLLAAGEQAIGPADGGGEGPVAGRGAPAAG